jgi:lipopolysaccharide/colanic/teichoic acid biosynthesis glycosyltransferase
MNVRAVVGPDSIYGRFGKRLLDLACTLAALSVLWPFMLAVAIAIRLTSSGPALFVQERLGRNATVFRAYKYRTMTDKPREFDTIAFSGDPSEITAIGRILRRTKMDELPQLLNVLKGDMSLVGPRPQLTKQLAEFDENAKQRLRVRPGLTGMAQTHGGVALTWPERWYYDALYVRTLSLKTDLWLIARTLWVITHGEERFVEHPPLD